MFKGKARTILVICSMLGVAIGIWWSSANVPWNLPPDQIDPNGGTWFFQGIAAGSIVGVFLPQVLKLIMDVMS